jgi:hypothetical protein
MVLYYNLGKVLRLKNGGYNTPYLFSVVNLYVSPGHGYEMFWNYAVNGKVKNLSEKITSHNIINTNKIWKTCTNSMRFMRYTLEVLMFLLKIKCTQVMVPAEFYVTQ